MQIIITAKVNKAKISKKDLNKTVDIALSISEAIYKKYHLKDCRCKCMPDRTTLILE